MNIDYQIKSKAEGNHKKLRDQMIQIINQVTGGLKMSFKRVDLDTGTVYFATDDGEIPVDAVSQGTASLIGWVGLPDPAAIRSVSGQGTERSICPGPDR